MPDMPGTPPVLDSLDANSYPHIVERVFAVASHDSLVRLRTGSRAFRAKADALLVAGRIIIAATSVPDDDVSDPNAPNTAPPPCTPAVVSSPSGRIPAFEPMSRGGLVNPDEHDLSRTRIVDLVGLRTLRPERERISCTRMGPAKPGPWDLLSVPSLDKARLIVRFMHNTSGERSIYEPLRDATHSVPAEPDTTVLFSPLPHVFREDWQAPALLAWPPGEVDLRRAVINISVHPDDRGPAQLSFAPVGVPETVWVFHRGEAPVIGVEGDRERQSDMIPALLWVMAVVLIDSVESTATVAGIEAFAGWPGWEAEEGEGDWETVLRHFRKRCRDGMRMAAGRRNDVEELVDTALERVRCMALAELRAELGPERAAVETMIGC